MKKNLMLVIILIINALTLSAQKSKDVLYLKSGSIVYGRLTEIIDNQYKMQTSDGSILIFASTDVERFAKMTPNFDGRKSAGLGFGLEAGLLAGAQHSDYSAPFSFNFLAGVTANTKNVINVGSGVEFIGKAYTPLFIEYKYLFTDKKATPFVFFRGGGVIYLGAGDSDTNYNNEYNTPFNYKGGGSFTIGTGISWAVDDYETYLSFAYRYAHISYQQMEYGKGTVNYESSIKRLEIKFGFRF